MTFRDEQFPPKVSLNAVGGPRFLTDVATMQSGYESRNRNWEKERGEWTVSFEARLPADWQPLVNFFRAVAMGRAYSFRFKDWTDFEAASGEGIFVDTDGSPTQRQMVKVYTFGDYTYYRVITKPVVGKITTNAVNLSYTTGIANSGTTWSGEFDVHCRLDNDPMRCQVIDRNPHEGLIVGWQGIELVEVRG